MSGRWQVVEVITGRVGYVDVSQVTWMQSDAHDEDWIRETRYANDAREANSQAIGMVANGPVGTSVFSERLEPITQRRKW
jgi:hypothetical protein